MNQKIAILCSGGDVSGMNPALKRFVEYAFAKGLHPYFVRNGYEGLIDNLITPADYHDVAGIITRGGTKIGSARSLRFKEPFSSHCRRESPISRDRQTDRIRGRRELSGDGAVLP